MTLDGRVPAGPITEKWDRHKFEMKLVNPANKRKFTIIVAGTGLAGASAAAPLREHGCHALYLFLPDRPQRADTLAHPGGVHAPANNTASCAHMCPVSLGTP